MKLNQTLIVEYGCRVAFVIAAVAAYEFVSSWATLGMTLAYVFGNLAGVLRESRLHVRCSNCGKPITLEAQHACVKVEDAI